MVAEREMPAWQCTNTRPAPFLTESEERGRKRKRLGEETEAAAGRKHKRACNTLRWRLFQQLIKTQRRGGPAPCWGY